jgi:PAS domain S-box-containing protein
MVLLHDTYQSFCAAGNLLIVPFLLISVLLVGGGVLIQIDRTKRKQAEFALQQLNQELESRVQQRTAALQDSEERYRQLVGLQEQQTRLNLALEAANMGIWEGNLITGEETLSPQAEALLGFAPGAFDGRRETFLNRVHPDDLDNVQQSGEVALKTGCLQDEYRIVLPDQTIRWIYCLGKVFYDEAGHPSRVVGVDLDITDRKRAEMELRQQKEILQTIFDHLPVMVGLYSATGEILIINRELERVIGWSQEEYQTVDVLRECYPDPADYQQVRNQIITADSLWHDFQLRTRDGRILDTSWAQIRLSDGCSIGIGQDITERKQAERALQDSETRFRQLAENIQEVFWMTDVDFTQTLYVSPIYEAVWKRTCASLYADPASFLEAIHPDDRDRVLAIIHNQRHQGWEQEYRIIQPDGTVRWISEQAFPVTEPTGEIHRVVGICHDISDRKRAELEIRQLNEALEQQNQNLEVLVEQRTAELTQRTIQLEASNQELESFSYSVSHDLRAPLRHINGFVNALQQHLQDHQALSDPKVVHYLQVIESSSQKMALLIDGLLTLSRIGRKAMTSELVSLRALVEEAIDLTRSSLGTTNPLEFVIGELPTVQGDTTLLQQVFSNLINNAVKFSRNHPAPRIEIGSLPDGTLFVKDNGVGFQMEYADKVFNAFQRLHSQAAFEGSGIGLAIVQRIIHRHGGAIWVESQPDQGATFYFTLGDSVQE